ncbi:MAG: hypothetical protein GX601_04725 [Anaerolineales bacterium]|nr:hypothetical protein [Anaerolineales bacterium]
MNTRERLLATMHFQPVDRCPLWEWHYLDETVHQWHAQGLPAEVYLPPVASGEWCAPAGSTGSVDPTDMNIADYFGLDRGQPYCPGAVELVPVNTGMEPPFETRTLAETAERCVFVDGDGITQEVFKDREPAMPRFIDFPVKSRADFEALTWRFDSTSVGRYPADWEQYKAQAAGRDYALGLTFDGFFGRLRKWMGLETMLLTLYDDPALIQEMCEFHTAFVLATIRQTLAEVRIDYANIWEDMAYKTGPLISPRHVRQYFLPGYRQIVDLLRSSGVDIIFVDSDGNLDLLIPIWLEAGINGVWPIEVAAGMDPVALRSQYGRDLLLVGGIDKRRLSKGRAELRDEVLSKVPALNEGGGYVATVDHSVPPDIPLDNYWLFRHMLAELA